MRHAKRRGKRKLIKPFKPFTITIEGTRFAVDRLESEYGICSRIPTIYILGKQGPQDEMDTAIHEVLHSIDMNLPEATVIKYARYITGMLWACGYRRK